MSDTSSRIVRGWNTISSAYLSRYEFQTDEISYGPMCPEESELGLLGLLEGLRVLDIGCGGGHNSIALARHGASVTAIDPSANQIAAAESLAKELGVEVDFVNCSAEEIDQLEGHYDIVFSVYALMFVEDIQSLFRKTHALLNDGGIVVVSVDHPFRISGEWDEQQRFVADNYFKSGWRSWDYAFPENDVQVEMFRHHRTIQQWFDAVSVAGFKVDRLIEPEPHADPNSFGTISKYGANDVRNVFHPSNLARIPGTLIFKGTKL